MDAKRLEDVKYDVSDVFALPEGECAELIDGDLYMMAPSTARTAVIVTNGWLTDKKCF